MSLTSRSCTGVESGRPVTSIRSRRGHASPLPTDANALAIPLRGGPTTVREALNILDAAAIQPRHIDLHEPSLDEVFLSLTGATA